MSIRFLAGLLLALLASSAHGQVPAFVPSSLTSPGSISAKSAPAGTTLAATFAYARGTTPALIAFRYNGPVAVTYSAYADSTFSFEISDSDPIGTYLLESVTFVESGGTTVYGRNGTIRRVSYSAPTLPTTHTLNFSSLDFSIASTIGFQRRYYRGATAPAVDSNNANPGAGWISTLGTGTDAVWEIFAAFNNGMFVPPWSAPVKISEERGIPGLPGGGGTPGTGILTPRMKNISVRTVIPDNGVLIAGFVLDQPKSVVVRGISQSLTAFGVAPGTLMPDPRIEIYSRDAVALLNDNFSASVAGNATRATASARATMARVGAFSLTSTRDAAVVVTLPAGAYTVHLKSVDGRGGDCLIEVYDADL